jgi:lambda repressor-like predicted transcriptional regulator
MGLTGPTKIFRGDRVAALRHRGLSLQEIATKLKMPKAALQNCLRTAD